MSVSLVDEAAAELDSADLWREAYARSDAAAHEWPEIRREILAQGGIGASPDWKREDWPADLYTGARGKAPDLVATETFIGRADLPPWAGAGAGDGGPGPSDSDMHAYLWRAWKSWQSVKAARVDVNRAPAPAKPRKLAPGERSFAELVAALQEKHGRDVDLAGLVREYVKAYESGERVAVTIAGREYRGTIGATRGARPRFVLLTSLPLPGVPA